MDAVRYVKIVYEDNSISKVIRGTILEEDEFSITIKAEPQGNILTIGKRALIKMEQRT